jgi:hypothetical protein
MTNNIPSIDPANLGTLIGTFEHIFWKNMQSVNGVMPATVIAYDRNSNPPRAQVQPAINIKTTDGQSIPRAQIVNVPVCRIGGGGYFIDFNVKPGDFGLLFTCDRDISLFLQNKKASAPNTNRIKNFSDSFFLPIVLKNATIDPENSELAVLQNEDGSICIAIHPDKVKIKGKLYVDGDIEASGNITPNVPP